MRNLVLVAFAGLLSACAQPTIWDKPGATQVDFNRDSYACQKDAIAAGGTIYYGYGVTGRNPDMNMYRQCMIVAGYTPRGKG
jgi:hypothetical protein